MVSFSKCAGTTTVTRGRTAASARSGDLEPGLAFPGEGLVEAEDDAVGFEHVPDVADQAVGADHLSQAVKTDISVNRMVGGHEDHVGSLEHARKVAVEAGDVGVMKADLGPLAQ